MKKSFTKYFLLIGVLSITLACSRRAKEPQDIVAKIDDFPITFQDFSEQWQRSNRNLPLDQASKEQKLAVLDEMIDEQVTLLEAYRLHYDQKEPMAKMAKEKERELAGRALRKHETEDAILTEQLLQQFYRWCDRELELLYMKFYAGSEKATQERAMKKAEKIHQRLLNGEDFKKLAVAFSEHDHAKSDSGKMGRVDCFHVNEEFFRQAYPLKEGQVTPPFSDGRSVWILKVEKIHPIQQKPFEQERANLRQKLSELYADKIAARKVQFHQAILDEIHFSILNEPTHFFCERTKQMRSLADTATIFSPEELKMVLAVSDIESTTIGDIFFMSAPYYWRSLPQRRVIEMLLRELHTNRGVKTKAMRLGYNEKEDVRQEYQNWLAYYLKKSVIQGEVIDKIDVSDKILYPLYEQRKSSLIIKKQATVREIFHKTEADIQHVYRLAKSGADFAQLQRQYSQNMEDRNEGIIGPFAPGMHGQLGELAFSLKVGEISAPFRYRGGFSIIQVLAQEPERIMTFAEAKETLKNDYIQSRWEEEVKAWKKKARKHYRVRTWL